MARFSTAMPSRRWARFRSVFAELGADLMTVSSHKLGGPKGIGALVAREGLGLAPQMSGGGQELRRRAGTENVAAIAGFGAAVEEGYLTEISELRNHLEKRLEAVSPQVTIFARDAARLPNTSCFALAGLAADTVLISLDLDGVAVSTGSACSSGKVARSHVLDAMAVEPHLARAAIRASLGWNTTRTDVDRFITAWRNVIERAHRIAA